MGSGRLSETAAWTSLREASHCDWKLLPAATTRNLTGNSSASTYSFCFGEIHVTGDARRTLSDNLPRQCLPSTSHRDVFPPTEWCSSKVVGEAELEVPHYIRQIRISNGRQSCRHVRCDSLDTQDSKFISRQSENWRRFNTPHPVAVRWAAIRAARSWRRYLFRQDSQKSAIDIVVDEAYGDFSRNGPSER